MLEDDANYEMMLRHKGFKMQEETPTEAATQGLDLTQNVIFVHPELKNNMRRNNLKSLSQK